MKQTILQNIRVENEQQFEMCLMTILY